jgi:hypothetical protein
MRLVPPESLWPLTLGDNTGLTIPFKWVKIVKVQEDFLVVEWACGAAGSALPWHGRGRRFDPDQVHQSFNNLADPPLGAWPNWPEISKTFFAF